jgi:predicted transcriptional regulator YdeE
MKFFWVAIFIILAKESGAESSQIKKTEELTMQKSISNLGEIKLIGIKVRTSFNNELNSEMGKILPCVMKYFHEKLFTKIPYRKKPGTTFCVYTEYEHDYRGNYSYFIGEEVSSLEKIPSGLESLTIPPQKYVKFTTEPGTMPSVVKDAWKKIWEMSNETLGGKRVYQSDFEIYDERAADENKIVLDLFIGIKPNEKMECIGVEPMASTMPLLRSTN